MVALFLRKFLTVGFARFSGVCVFRRASRRGSEPRRVTRGQSGRPVGPVPLCPRLRYASALFGPAFPASCAVRPPCPGPDGRARLPVRPLPAPPRRRRGPARPGGAVRPPGLVRQWASSPLRARRRRRLCTPLTVPAFSAWRRRAAVKGPAGVALRRPAAAVASPAGPSRRVRWKNRLILG